MLYRKVTDLILDDVFLDLSDLVEGIRLILKLENFNFGGSIKVKPAISLLDDGERRGLLQPGGRVIESSSGNLGIALSSVCAVRGYHFTCVIDPNTPRRSISLMKALGAHVAEVFERDANGGFLQTRIDFITGQLAADPQLFWPNQYANPVNPLAHYERTAAAIAREVPGLACLFVGVGTTGTLMGCAAYFREHLPATKIVAVDAEGSVSFGFAAGPRHIPGLGTSRRPEILRPELADEVVLIPEAETVRMCRRVASEHGLAIGGSTGSVLAAVARARDTLPRGATVVAIGPDAADPYLDTVYNDQWVAERFGPAVLKPAVPAAAPEPGTTCLATR
jgi:N-(2-amino-2-carboxyethyl)-L-glutamate synthase